jgi:hypothetical protein
VSDSYEQGSKVRFTCSKPGYIPINPQPIECVEQPECKVVKPLGITSGRIPDSAINATSERGNYEARNIRYVGQQPVLRIRIHRIHMFLDRLNPDPDLLVRGMHPDPDPDPSIN